MTIYQKAIKVRKTCEVQKDCRECPYHGNCKTTNFFLFTPVDEVEELEETSIEVSLVEDVENLTDDLFQDEVLAYCDEAIERESNKNVLQESS